MGNFYVSHLVETADVDAVAAHMKAWKRKSFVSPSSDGFVGVFDHDSDLQKSTVIEQLATQLSSAIGHTVIAVLNHDDDVLAYWLSTDGKLIDTYNSKPGFDEDLTAPPSGGNAVVLCETFGRPEKQAEVRAVLTATKDRYVFEVDRHLDLCRLLGLPWTLSSNGFSYIEDGSSPDLDRRGLIEIE